MSTIDPISNLVTSINNKIALNKTELVVPYSRFRKEILNKLKEENVIANYEEINDEKYTQIKIYLLKKPYRFAIISKPGRKIYAKYSEIPRKKRELIILSTSTGLLTAKQAIKKQIGGELIMEVS